MGTNGIARQTTSDRKREFVGPTIKSIEKIRCEPKYVDRRRYIARVRELLPATASPRCDDDFHRDESGKKETC